MAESSHAGYLRDELPHPLLRLVGYLLYSYFRFCRGEHAFVDAPEAALSDNLFIAEALGRFVKVPVGESLGSEFLFPVFPNFRVFPLPEEKDNGCDGYQDDDSGRGEREGQYEWSPAMTDLGG